jgi:prophage maintenance system killer protein
LALTFLARNGYWLRMNSDEMYQLALRTAESTDSEKMLMELNDLFGKRVERASLLGLLATWMKGV